jgi:NCAIR mutase (PurE)-related protein
MDIAAVIALVIAVPVILVPAALIWYLNIGGMTAVLKEARLSRKQKESARVAVKHE